jgi:hypothetical protein
MLSLEGMKKTSEREGKNIHAASGTYVTRERGGRFVKRDSVSGKFVEKKIERAPALKPVQYDKSDIEEANRIGRAVIRQHAK